MSRGKLAIAGIVTGLSILIVSSCTFAATPFKSRLTAQSSRGARTVLSVTQALDLVDFYATRHGVPVKIARNLVTVESSWRQNAVSPVGARGFTQLMPGTARELGVNINDPEENIEGGMRYLARMYERFENWELALAAYNTGPNRVAAYGAVPPWTRSYVTKILYRPASIPSAVTAAQARAAAKQAKALARAELRRLQKAIAAMKELPAGVRRSKGILWSGR